MYKQFLSWVWYHKEMKQGAKTIFVTALSALSLSVALLITPVASAHILRSDGSMSAELHVEPDDAPVTKVPVAYRLSFYESAGKFSLKDCNCSVTFVRDGMTTARKELNATTDTVSENSVTFAEPGTYTFKVTGTPKTAGSFAPFTLSYEERVGTPASDQSNSTLTWWLIGLASVAAVVYAVVTLVRRFNNRSSD